MQMFYSDCESSTVSLILFEEKLKSLYNLFVEQNMHFSTEFENLTGEELMEIILTVEATVVYNGKRNILSIKEKDD